MWSLPKSQNEFPFVHTVDYTVVMPKSKTVILVVSVFLLHLDKIV